MPALLTPETACMPTQPKSPLDLMTVREKKGELNGKRIAIIGDITHSRVARSNCIGFTKMGASVILAGRLP